MVTAGVGSSLGFGVGTDWVCSLVCICHVSLTNRISENETLRGALMSVERSDSSSGSVASVTQNNSTFRPFRPFFPQRITTLNYWSSGVSPWAVRWWILARSRANTRPLW